MIEREATYEDHQELAQELRDLVDLVATHSLDEAAVRDAKEALAAVRASLSAAAASVPTRRPDAIPRWPVERSAVSGPLNPFAPPLVVTDHGDELVGTMTYPRSLQGPPEHAHGGHLAMVFDHLAGRMAARAGKPIVTGRLAVRYHAPTPVGTPIRFVAKLRESRHSLVTIDCTAFDGATKTSSAEITFVELGASHFVKAFGRLGEN